MDDKVWIIVLAFLQIVAFGTLAYYFKALIDRKEKKEIERQTARERKEELLLRGTSASLALGEATAEAIERQQFNGEMLSAKERAKEVKMEIEDFVTKQYSKNVA